MDLPDSITVHESPGDVSAMWNSLVTNGGYTVYMDANGGLHALKFNPGWVAAS